MSANNMSRSESSTSGRVFWICGLSGAGKTTLALELAKRLRAKGKTVVLLDGDELREIFYSSTTNSHDYIREGRLKLAMKYSYLCRLLASQDLTVVISTISLFREVFMWNRTNLPRYFEIYLKTPIEELRRRDPKGIYRRFDAGELTHVAGLDVLIDEPEEADLVVDFLPGRTVEMVVDKLMQIQGNKGL